MPSSKIMLQPDLEQSASPVFNGLVSAAGKSMTGARGRAAGQFVDLADIPERAWSDLADRAIEPNAFYDPAWARAVSAHGRGHAHARALLVWNGAERERLIGLLPVVSAWRALKLPVPVLVAWGAYAPLTTPLLDREAVGEATAGLLDAARLAGAAAILFPNLAQGGPAATAIAGTLSRRAIRPHVHESHQRARLDATGDAAALLRDALGPKKLKELRRQRNRLADRGAVEFRLARSPEEIASALDTFLALEVRGWKGKRGTALCLHAGDERFIREAATALAARRGFEIATLSHGGLPVAAGLLLRHQRRAYFFKIAIDETEARNSPGVQLTLDLTRHYCEDAGIDDVDSTADADHPMIDHVWRGRQPLCHLFAPTQPNNFITDLVSGVIAGRAIARAQGRRLVRAVHHFREK
jgi:CelD/BcsL family acetyltransferase involved in cellulose biosynthesis